MTYTGITLALAAVVSFVIYLIVTVTLQGAGAPVGDTGFWAFTSLVVGVTAVIAGIGRGKK